MQDSMVLNLFFLRILKEHMLFMQLSFTPKDRSLAARAEELKQRLTELLRQTVTLSKGYISETVMASGELFTRFTEEAERQTQMLSGVPIDIQLTREEYNLGGGAMPPPTLKPEVDRLNQNALALAQQVLQYKQKVIEDVAACRVFTTNYPTLIDHIARENQHYIIMLTELVSGNMELGPREIADEMAFWNTIMSEHGMFIDGYLDPSEDALKAMAEEFADEFEMLAQQAEAAEERPQMIPQIVVRSEEATRRIRSFKQQATNGLLSCSIRSIIIPLLSDHVLREANHYLRMLREHM
jgi:hypothetical protein